MLLHLLPTLLLFPPDLKPTLIDLTVAPYGLRLSGQTDLATRQPYRNKQLWVPCRRLGRLAVEGILIVAPRVEAVSVTLRWAVGAERVLVHTARLTLLDDEHDTVSTDLRLLHAMHASLGGWPNRHPDRSKLAPDLAAAARGDLLLPSHPHPDLDHADDRIEDGRLVERRQHIARPTIERGRLHCLDDGCMPQLADAFVAG